tara:strand:+ start:5019 stop:5483 length:465 start_codon:yes stop_codon:yes gene_type:complete
MDEQVFNPALQSRRTGLSWDKEFRPRVDDIKKALSVEGVELKNRSLFLLCLALGWEGKSNPGVPPRATDSARLDTLQDSDWALFNAIAMDDSGGFEILASKDGVLDIVEGYAAGGLRILAEKLDSSNSLTESLIQDIWPKLDAWSPSIQANDED